MWYSENQPGLFTEGYTPSISERCRPSRTEFEAMEREERAKPETSEDRDTRLFYAFRDGPWTIKLLTESSAVAEVLRTETFPWMRKALESQTADEVLASYEATIALRKKKKEDEKAEIQRAAAQHDANKARIDAGEAPNPLGELLKKQYAAYDKKKKSEGFFDGWSEGR